MPYHVKAGSLLIVASTHWEAVRLYDDIRKQQEDISVRDMDGIEIDVEQIRSILNEGEPS